MITTAGGILLAILFVLFLPFILWFIGFAVRGVFWILMFFLIFLLVAGCADMTPYVAARHLDATPAAGGADAWDVGCVGGKVRGQLSAKAGYCWNIRGGNMLEASIEYDLFR